MASSKVRIRFEGNTLECRGDTTVAAALWENGVRHLSTSPKYGRPRGVTCARGQCTACLMRVDGIPNVRTCELAVRDGMEISRQEAGPFYAAPMQKILASGSAFFPVGFYYKWFTRPPFLSRMFLDGIRPMTGVGRIPSTGASLPALPGKGGPAPADGNPVTDLGRFDTIVIGAGPSGLEAAARATGKVLAVDDHVQPGGQRLGALRFVAERSGASLDRFGILRSSLERIETARNEFEKNGNATFLERTRAIAGYHPDGLLLRRGEILQTVKFDHLVWAAGALDTLGLFPGNDTPGVVGPRALYRLLARDGLQVAGLKALVIGGGFDFWLSAAVLAAAGARPTLVVTDDAGADEISAAVDLKWPLNTGLKLDGIHEHRPGRLQASFVPCSSGNDAPGARLDLEADLAVVCNRGKPAYDIIYQLGADLTLRPDLGGFTLPADRADDAGPHPVDAPRESRIVPAGEACGLLPGRHRSPGGGKDGS